MRYRSHAVSLRVTLTLASGKQFLTIMGISSLLNDSKFSCVVEAWVQCEDFQDKRQILCIGPYSSWNEAILEKMILYIFL